MIGHALAFAPRLSGRLVWDRWIAIGFAVGSACFFVGPFPGFVQLAGAGADGVVFFAGSIFFTLAALLELRESTLRLGRWAADPSWWSAAVQFAGTLLFNLSTFEAMQDGLSTTQEQSARVGTRRLRLDGLSDLGSSRLPRGEHRTPASRPP